MRSAFLTLLLLAAGGIMTTIPTANASFSNEPFDPEGVVMPFAAGDHFSWRIAGDQFLLYTSAYERGADIDISQAGILGYPGPIMHMRAHEVDGNHFSQVTNDIRKVSIRNGSGIIAVVRNELSANVSLANPPAHKWVDVELDPGSCRLYLFDTGAMSERVLLHGIGEGVAFQVFSDNLSLDGKSLGEINATVDPNRTAHEFIQACNPSQTDAAEARVERIYPHPNPPAPRSDSGHPLPIPGPAYALLVIAAVAALGKRASGRGLP
jgi:hypothetical protein